jgi:hydroxymethylglutaryl-CoA lyase
VLSRARQDGVGRRVYLAPAWVCPFEGMVEPDHVVSCAELVADDDVEIALADTIGHADPLSVGRLFDRFARRFGAARLAAHLHDTQGLALANAAAALAAGVRTIDASVGGLGGCPFAPGAAGNLATCDLVLMLEKMGFDTGVDLARLHEVVSDAERALGRPLGGRSRAWWLEAGHA